MNTLLALETADTACGVAVWDNGACRAAAHIHRPRVHAARLTPLIQETLAHADMSAGQVDAVAVSAGPGSYTGLRIGMSTAKGFTMARNLSLIPVPTLEAAAYALAPWASPGDLVVPTIDARRNDVFAAAYLRTDKSWSPLVDAGPYDISTLADAVWDATTGEGIIWCTGPGAEKAATPLRSHDAAQPVASKIRVVPASHRALSARHVAQRGWTLAHEGVRADPRTVEPAYLKAFHGTPSAKSV